MSSINYDNVLQSYIVLYLPLQGAAEGRKIWFGKTVKVLHTYFVVADIRIHNQKTHQNKEI